MSIAFWFWVIFVIGVVFHVIWRDRYYFVTSLWIVVLLFLLGLGEFGSPIK